jgi:hypothetical protein
LVSKFENRVLRRIFGRKRKRQETGEDSVMRNFIAFTLHHIPHMVRVIK